MTQTDKERASAPQHRDDAPSVFECFGGRDSLLACGESGHLRESRGAAACESRNSDGLWVGDGPYFEVFSDRPDRVRRVGLRRDGESHGRQYNFDRNGRLTQILEHQRGKLEGTLISCSETGQVRELKHYLDGEPDGEALVFREDGSLSRKTIYRRGERVRTLYAADIGSAPRAPTELCRPTQCSVDKK